MATLHIGSFRPDLVREVLPDVEGEPHDALGRYEHGDSWEEWGESRGDLHVPAHLVVRRRKVEHALIDLANVVGALGAAQGVLQPMTMHFQRGVIAVVTEDHDWEQAYFTMLDARARKFLSTEIADVRHGAWHDPRWRAFRNLGPLIPDINCD